MKSSVSVIIPVYNVENYVRRCVNSVFVQDYPEMEILLIDDGSTDSSGTICDNLAEQDDRIKVFHTKNNGLGPARNLGIEKSNADWIFLVDSDDFIFEGIIRKLIKAAISNNADVVCCGYQSANKKAFQHKDTRIYNGEEAVRHMFISDDMDANAVCKLYRRELFQGISYPAGYGEVIPVTWRILLRCKKVVSIGEVGYYIEKREGSITRSPFSEKNFLYTEMAYEVYKEISVSYPEIADAAYTFYQSNIISLAERASLVKENKKNAVCIELKKAKGLLKKEFIRILNNSNISFERKMIAILTYTNLYKFAYQLKRTTEQSK